MAVTFELNIDDIYAEFEELADWDERCDYLIDLGFEIPKLPESAKTEQNKVHGCQSNVWLVAEVKPTKPPIVEFVANSDAIIVNGLIAILMALYSRKTPREILAVDAQQVFTRLGLEHHLSSQRRNGLYSMVERIRRLAVEAEARA